MMDIEHIYLRDADAALVNAWHAAFKNVGTVKAEQGDFFAGSADAMVSPANSFGIMDGGLDLAIRHELGSKTETRVQECIVRDYYGELPVGNAAVVATDHSVWPYLIVAPTMRVPMDVRHTLNAYLAFRAVLIAVHRHNTDKPEDAIRTLICPGLATGVGRISPARCALQMKLAFEQFERPARIPGASELREMYRRLAKVAD